MSKLTLFLRHPIEGKNRKGGAWVPYHIDRIECLPVGEGEEPDNPEMIEAAHSGFVDAAGQALATDELRRWKIRDGIMDAYRDTVWYVPPEDAAA